MCGIIGYLSLNNNSLNILYNGLKQLQNRGYDSAGISYIKNNMIENIKYASDDNDSALNKLNKNLNYNLDINYGIGHTRWATHGAKTDYNAHPHICYQNKFVLVHNGIIENFEEIKKNLLKKGIKFKSETDSEVIINSISYYSNYYTVEESIQKTLNLCNGTWAIIIMTLNNKNTLYLSRHGSPLLLSYNENYALITSEQSGFQNLVNNYIVLENSDIIKLSIIDNKIFFKNELKNILYQNKEINKIDEINLEDSGYNHWTIKEIHEQSESIRRGLSLGGRILSNYEVKLGGLNDNKDLLKNIDNIILLGCGTSYHSGLIGMYYLKDLCNFNSVQLFDGAEFEVHDIPKIGNSVFILISQSGETKDLHRCIQIAQENNIFTIGVINVVDSLIAREVNCGCYLNAGREIGVASTKAFTSQCLILALISIWFSQIHNINLLKRKNMIDDLRKLPNNINEYLKNENIKDYIHLFKNKKSTFILGKGKSHAIALEGALKIKEISYIHAEGYSSSSLKHGPFALLEKDFPVILINPNDKYWNKSNNAYQELLSRNANVIVIGETIKTPINKSFQEIINIIPLQLIAYYISIDKGYNPDMPKNLAKVVTVE